MTKVHNRRDKMTKLAKSRRATALERVELRFGTNERRSAAGPTSFPMKAEDAETRRMIDEALARRSR